MAIICSHCFIFCLQLAANRGSFKLPLQAPSSSLHLQYTTILASTSWIQHSQGTGHHPWCKIAAAPVVGKVRTKASEESYCSGQLPETQPDPIFRNSRDAYGRVSKQEYTEITILMGKMMMKPWDFVSALFWGCLLWIYVNLGGSALYPRREVRWSSKLGHKQLLPDAVPQELATSLSWCWTPLLAGSQLIRPTGQ